MNATLHDLYLGDSFGDVDSGAASTFKGRGTEVTRSSGPLARRPPTTGGSMSLMAARCVRVILGASPLRPAAQAFCVSTGWPSAVEPLWAT